VDIHGSYILFSGSGSLLRKVGPSLESRDFSLFVFSNSIISLRVMLLNAADVPTTAYNKETISLVPEVDKVGNYCFVDFRDKLMLNDDLSFCNKEYDVKSNVTHFDSPCALACYPKIIDRLASLNEVFRMDKYNIVVIRHQNLLSDLKDRPDPVGYLEIDVSSDLDPIKNKYGSVQTSTRLLVNKAPSCLDCPTPSSVHNDAKNGGVIPQEFNPVITQSSAVTLFSVISTFLCAHKSPVLRVEIFTLNARVYS